MYWFFRFSIFVASFFAFNSMIYAQIEHKLDSLRQVREGLLLDELFETAYRTYLCEQIPGAVPVPENSAAVLHRSMKYYRGLRDSAASPQVFSLPRIQAYIDILKSMRAVAFALEVQEDLKKRYPEAAKHNCSGKHCHCAPEEKQHHK